MPYKGVDDAKHRGLRPILVRCRGKKKDTIPASNLWMVSFFWNGLHAIQVVLHYIKQVAGLQIFLLH
jgi:hypothetical protein